MSDKTLGYCGLYCGACGVYQMTQAGTPKLDDSKQPLVCEGCNSDRVSPWCSDCAIKNCARSRGYRVCGECPEKPCPILSGFIHDPKYPYHKAVLKDMECLAEKGIGSFERMITERYTCALCGAKFDWLATECNHCGKTVIIEENR